MSKFYLRKKCEFCGKKLGHNKHDPSCAVKRKAKYGDSGINKHPRKKCTKTRAKASEDYFARKYGYDD